jgi:hypothetical protein
VQNERRLKRESFKLSKYFFGHLETEEAGLVTSYKKKNENKSKKHLLKKIFSGQEGFTFEIYNCLAI